MSITLYMRYILVLMSVLVVQSPTNLDEPVPQHIQIATKIMNARIKIIKIEIQHADAEVKRTTLDYERALILFKKRTIPKAEYDDAEHKTSAATYQKTRHKARLEEAKALLELAEFNGTVDSSLTIR